MALDAALFLEYPAASRSFRRAIEEPNRVKVGEEICHVLTAEWLELNILLLHAGPHGGRMIPHHGG
jgi:hypothetical protein